MKLNIYTRQYPYISFHHETWHLHMTVPIHISYHHEIWHLRKTVPIHIPYHHETWHLHETVPIHIPYHHQIDIFTRQYPHTSGHETGRRTVTRVSTHAHKTHLHELVIRRDGSQEVRILSAEGQLRGSGHVGHHRNMKRVGESSNVCCGCAGGCSNDTCTQQDCLQWYLHTTRLSTMIPAHSKTVYNDTCTQQDCLQW